MRLDPRSLLPLKPLVFQVLVALAGEARHGWSLVREIQQTTGGDRILPANFYRTLRGMLADGLIADAPGAGEPRRRYFRLTPLGEAAGRAETQRLRALLERTPRAFLKKA
jgi:DNA-binding PadR family transcriptional regulator